MKFTFFYRFSLRSKLTALVALLLVSVLFSISGAYYIINRVKIGGLIYKGIELKTRRLDLLDRTRVNASLLNSTLKTQVFAGYDPDSRSSLSAKMARIDAVFKKMAGNFRPDSTPGHLYCGSCHSLAFASEVKEYDARALTAWDQMKQDVKYKMLPALGGGNNKTAQAVFAGAYSSHFHKVMDNTRQEIKALRGALGAVRTTMNHEADHLLLYYTLAGLVSMAALIGLAVLLVEMIARVIRHEAGQLTEGSSHITGEIQATTSLSRANADMATEMAASLEETSASLEEITSMVRQTKVNSGEARNAVIKNSEVSQQTNTAMQEMRESMRNIQADSDKISTTINEIDSIAFQTNLLALNAAVEAARAGDYGQGFAVVADGVRTLAQRTASAAKNSQGLISQAILNVSKGLTTMKTVADGAKETAESSGQLSTLIDKIVQASRQQADGITTINQEITRMDEGVQKLAADSVELAATSQAVGEQLQNLHFGIEGLEQLITGKKIPARRK